MSLQQAGKLIMTSLFWTLSNIERSASSLKPNIARFSCLLTLRKSDLSVLLIN